MRKQLIFLLTSVMVVISSCSQKERDSMVLVKGGTFKDVKSNLYAKGVTVPDFYIGKYEVTQKEWMDIMGSNPSKFKGDDLPVETVSWYDCIKFCNRKSAKEGLQPYYNIDSNKVDTNNLSKLDSLKWTVTINKWANGYRLPTEIEWEYAAGGGQKSRSYTYSGSNNIDEVAWYYKNSGDKYLKGVWMRSTVKNNHCRTRPVGWKKPNELGLYDMSGNVREWCWNWYGDSLITKKGSNRVWRGGGWLGAQLACVVTYRGKNAANSRYDDTGLRLCRSVTGPENKQK